LRHLRLQAAGQCNHHRSTKENHMNARIAIATAVATALFGVTAIAQTQDAPPPRVMPKCDKPLASVMVGKISCKSANCDAGASAGRQNPLFALMSAVGQPNVSAIGEGIKDMFITAIRSTGCVDLQEREALNELAEELKLAGKTLQVQQADFMISGALTSVEVSNTSTNIGWGLIPIIGSVGVRTQTATVAMDIRLVDVNKAKIVDTRKIEATSENTSWGVGGLGVGSVGGAGVGFGGAFSSLKGTSLEVVSRDAVLTAAAFVIESLQRQQGVTTAAQQPKPASQPSQVAVAPTVPAPAAPQAAALQPATLDIASSAAPPPVSAPEVPGTQL
jgi:curli biogenesis system outer membrane secretion channel CsgG